MGLVHINIKTVADPFLWSILQIDFLISFNSVSVVCQTSSKISGALLHKKSGKLVKSIKNNFPPA
jgi:hypothetical protein